MQQARNGSNTAWQWIDGTEYQALVTMAEELKNRMTPLMVEFTMAADVAIFKKSYKAERVVPELQQFCNNLESLIEQFASRIGKAFQSHSVLKS